MLFHVLNRALAECPSFEGGRILKPFNVSWNNPSRRPDANLCVLLDDEPLGTLGPLARTRWRSFQVHAERMSNMHTQRWQRAKLKVATDICIKAGSSHFRLKTTNIFIASCGMSSANALRAGLVRACGGLEWGSLHQRATHTGGLLLSDWPLSRPSDWID